MPGRPHSSTSSPSSHKEELHQRPPAASTSPPSPSINSFHSFQSSEDRTPQPLRTLQARKASSDLGSPALESDKEGLSVARTADGCDREAREDLLVDDALGREPMEMDYSPSKRSKASTNARSESTQEDLGSKKSSWSLPSYKVRTSFDQALPSTAVTAANGVGTIKRERKRSSSSQRSESVEAAPPSVTTPPVSATSSFFPLFGTRSKVGQTRSASSPKPGSAGAFGNARNTATSASSPDTGSFAPRAVSQPAPRTSSSSSARTSSSAGDRPAERRLTYLKDVVAQQKREGESLPSQKDKLLPPLPFGLGIFDPIEPSSAPRPVSTVIVTPSTPVASKGVLHASQPSDNGYTDPSNTDSATDVSLERDRTLRARSKIKSKESDHNSGLKLGSALAPDDKANGPRLRHVKSLGIGKPSMSRANSETSTIHPYLSSTPGSVSSILLGSREANPAERNLSPASASNIRFAPEKLRSATDLLLARPFGGEAEGDDHSLKRRTLKRANSFAGISRTGKVVGRSGASSPHEPPSDIAMELQVSPEEISTNDVSAASASTSVSKPSGSGLFRGAAEWLGLKKSSKRKTEERNVETEEVVVPGPIPHQHASPVTIPAKAASTQATSSGWSFGAKSPAEASTVASAKRSRSSTLIPPASPQVGPSPPISPRSSSLARFNPFAHNLGATRRSAQPSPALPQIGLPDARRESSSTDGLPVIRTTSPTEGDFFDGFFADMTPERSGTPMEIHTEKFGAQITGLGLPDPLSDFSRPSSSRSGVARSLGSNRAFSDPAGRHYPASLHGEVSRGVDELASPTVDIGDPHSPRPSLGRRSNSGSVNAMDRVKIAVGGRRRSGSLRKNGGTPNVNSTDVISPSASTVSLLSSAPSRMSRHGSYDRGLESPPLNRLVTSRPQSHQSLAAAAPGSPIAYDEAQPRPSISGSYTSSNRSHPEPATVRRTLAFSERGEPASSSTSSIKGRPRSSTLSAVNPSRLQAVSGAPTKKRPGSMRRLSTGFFGIGPSSDSSPLFPLPAKPLDPTVAPTSVGNGPKLPASTELAGRARSKDPQLLPQPDESAPEWLSRLLVSISRSDVANILASSNDSIYTFSLELFMDRFDFFDDALDIALRKLLMDIALPRETQQIDRVMEAFAKRYQQCQPGLFVDPDHPYVLAFSLIMLHTDAFNKNNKNKMTKWDYVRNTKLTEVSPLILETFYDNICYTPFVFVEDEMDQQDISAGNVVDTPVSSGSFLVLQQSQAQSGSVLKGGGKTDVYQLITQGGLSSLRLNLSLVIPFEDPFTFLGTRPFYDHAEMQRVFAAAPNLQVSESKARRKSGATLITTDSGVVPGAIDRGSDSSKLNLKVIKVGLLSRKDDYLEGRRKATNRKWKSWSVILTGSQLVFLKDTTWALSLLNQIADDNSTGQPGRQLYPRVTDFRPDEVFSLKSAAAIFDRSYSKYSNTFRLMLAQGRQFLLQSGDEFEMNEWISAINYASTYKTASLRMRYPLEPGTRVSSIVNSDSSSALPSMSATLPVLPSAGMQLPPITSDMLDGKSSASTVVKSDVLSLDLRVKRGVSTGASSRVHALEAKIIEFTSQAAPTQSMITADLRVARNLSLLTPFQRSSREKLESAVPGLARRISESRLELAQLICWTSILRADLESYSRNRRTARVVSRATNRTSDSLASNGSLVSRLGDQSGTESDALASDDFNHPILGNPDILEQEEPESDDDDPPGPETEGAELPVNHTEDEDTTVVRPPGLERRNSSASFHTAWGEQAVEEGPADKDEPEGEMEDLKPSWSGHGRKVSLAEVPPVGDMSKLKDRLKGLSSAD